MDALVFGLWLAFPDPLLTELPRFPCAVACETWRASVRFTDHLDTQLQQIEPGSDDLQLIRREARYLERCWDALDWAARTDCHGKPCFSIEQRRHYLGVLRGLIGEDAYRLGLMPPHVPVWRFARAD